MPATLDLVLDLQHRPEVYPARMHGAACALLGHPQPNGRPRFSVWPLIDIGGHAAWRIGWLAADPCRRGIRSVLFGDTTHTVVSLDVREWSFAELATAPPTRHAHIEVHSPMYFSRNHRDHPLPDPVLIIQSLIGRWDHHAPAPLAVPEDSRRALLSSVYLVDMDGHTATGAVGRQMTQTGFVGSVTLGLTREADDGAAALFTTLLRYAEIAGIGAQTGHGFGAVRVTPGRPRPARTDQLQKAENRRGPRKPVSAGQTP